MDEASRGKLQWEDEVSAEDRGEITHAGNEEILQAYIDENFESLQKEVEDIQNAASSAGPATADLPFTSAEWISWLDKHDAVFKDHLRTATESRKHLGQRLQPLADDMP